MPRYRVEEVEAQRINQGGPSALEECLNSRVGYDERVLQIIPFPRGGYTERYLVVIEPLQH
jgi:hypothetical protein